MFGLFGKNPTKGATGALAEFYAAQAQASGTKIEELKLLAVDMETTGLRAGEHSILSIGWVPINGREIDLAGAGYVLVAGRQVGESAVIHHLTDDMLQEGASEEVALTALFQALAGRVMLNHFSALETSFLDVACKKHFGAGFVVDTVDTFALERRHMEKMGTYPRGEDLRLARVRSRYHLPNYRNHNALTDALACAELYLALMCHTNATTLKSIRG